MYHQVYPKKSQNYFNNIKFKKFQKHQYQNIKSINIKNVQKMKNIQNIKKHLKILLKFLKYFEISRLAVPGSCNSLAAANNVFEMFIMFLYIYLTNKAHLRCFSEYLKNIWIGCREQMSLFCCCYCSLFLQNHRLGLTSFDMDWDDFEISGNFSSQPFRCGLG